LLNPKEFWGDIPFPSVAYDEPTYDPLGYWRGRMWGHVYFWNTELLRLHGFESEAEEAKARYLRVAAAHKESMENFPSDPAQLHHRTVRSYNWCGSVTAFFLMGWHRRPVQLELG
jgi:glycogen debranching enzyme